MSEEQDDSDSYSASFESMDDTDPEKILPMNPCMRSKSISQDSDAYKSNELEQMIRDDVDCVLEEQGKKEVIEGIADCNMKGNDDQVFLPCLTWLFKNYIERWRIKDKQCSSLLLQLDTLFEDQPCSVDSNKNSQIHNNKTEHQRECHAYTNKRKRFKEKHIHRTQGKSKNFPIHHHDLSHAYVLNRDVMPSNLKSFILDTQNEILKIKKKFHRLTYLFDTTQEFIFQELLWIRNNHSDEDAHDNVESDLINNESDFISISSQMDFEGLFQHKKLLTENIHHLSQQRDILLDAIQRADDNLSREKLKRYNIFSVPVHAEDGNIPFQQLQSEKDNKELLHEKHRELEEEITRLSLTV